MKPLTHEPASNSVTSQVRRLRVDAILISSDDSFLIELGPLLGDSYRTHTVDSPLALGNLAHKSGWLTIVDVAALPDARAAVTRMSQRYPAAPIIVVAPSSSEWDPLISRGIIADAVARAELSGARFSEALSKAAARVREDTRSDTALSGSFRGGNPFESRPDRTLPVRALSLWIALAIALSGVGLWWWQRASSAHHSVVAAPESAAGSAAATAAAQAPTSAPASASSAPAPSSQTVLELLSAARVQFHDQKLLFPRPDGDPRGDSALELYAQVLSQDPANAEALDGIERLWVIAKERIQGDIESSKLEDATRLIALFKAAGLSNELLQPLSAGINAARPRLLLARAQQSIDAGDLAGAEQLISQLVGTGADAETLLGLRRAMDAKKQELQLTALSTRVQSAITAGALLAPEGENALAQLASMRAINRNHALTLAAQRELRAALLTRASQAAQQRQFDVATRFLSAAADLGASSEVADARRQLQQQMEQAAQAAQAAAAPSPSTPTAAPQAAAARPAAPSYIAATPLRPLDVSYPSPGRGIEGHVIVEFTLHANGSATDPVIIDARPAGLFDRAALTAVRRGRYDTSALAGSPTQRARISLHFKPD